MHPVFEEFCRIGSLHNIRPEYFRRVQRLMRDEIQPLLNERETLIEQNHALTEANAALKRQLEEKPKRARKDTEAVPA